jgi:hypothetical protein
MLQTPDGGVIYKVSGGNTPMSSGDMVADIKQKVWEWKQQGLPKRPCPRPEPKPTPAPAPVEPVDPIPDTVEPNATLPGGYSWWVYAVAAALGLLGGAIFGAKRDDE